MWVYIITSFTRYRKIGTAARREFESAITKDGFVALHRNLFARYCTSSDNATMHKERVKKMIPERGCDVSILLVSDSNMNQAYHRLGCRRGHGTCVKPEMVDFF